MPTETRFHGYSIPAGGLLLALALACALSASADPEPDLESVSDPVCREVEGRLVTFQDFQGLRTTNADVVTRELRNHPGERFTCAKWKREQVRLEDLDIFSEVRLETAARDSQVALTYRFRELPPYIPFVALAKTDQDGLSLGPALASLNFLGQGIRAEFITRFGGTTEAQASLTSTRVGPLPLQYDLAVLRVDSYNDFEAFHEDSWRSKLDLALGMEQWGWPEPAFLIAAAELFHMGAAQSDSAVVLRQDGDWVPRLAIGARWDSRDRRHLPRQGWYQEARVTENGGFLGGPADYREWLSDSRLYLPWQRRNTAVAVALYQYRDGTLGETFGRYDRFHAGGSNTLRGFGHDALRGKSECILTLENRTDLMGKRNIRLWHWGAFIALQGIVGLETASLWDHNALLERDFHPAGYVGLHLLASGIDRLRIEAGSKFAKFEFAWDLGVLDKADVQRFRAR
ncbi:MAG: BamA/TamA family outer membrane protein [Fibrobacteres bacterium]|nr:BamA/TamA family outer membrane protein [Fibrobacterota bacterium]